MICAECHEEIEGTYYTERRWTCHPSIISYEVKVCQKCHFFAKDNTESNNKVIKE